MFSVDLLRLADLLLKVSLVIGAAELGTRVLARWSAAARHLIWSVAIGAALALPVLTAVVPAWTVAVLPATAQSDQVRAEDEPVQDSGKGPVAFQRSDATSGPALGRLLVSASNEPERSSWPEMTTRTAIAAIWIVGALLVLTRLAFGTTRLWWLARRARPAGETAWAPFARRLAASLQLDGRVTFVSGRRDAMPMAWGLWRARVLLPAEADSWPSSRQQVVLLHELAHVKRRDCLTQLLAQLACAAYWFNPLVWLAARRLRTEREHACDDLVLAAGTRGSDYADHLLDIAKSLRRAAAPGWSAVAMAHRSQLEGRLMAILDPALPRRSPTRAVSAVCASLAIACVVPLAAIRPVTKPSPAEATAVTPANPEGRRPLQEPLKTARVTGSEPSELTQGRPSAPLKPTPIPTPTTPTPMPNPTFDSPPNWSSNPDIQIDIDPGNIADAIANAIGQSSGRGGLRGRGWGAERGRDVDPKVVAALVEALNDPDKDVRQTALHTLSQMRAPVAAEAFVKLLKDAAADVRQQAAFALGQTRDPKHVDALIGALKDASGDVREQAAFALGQIRDRRAVDALITTLKDEDPDVRGQSAFALSQLRDPRAINALIAALKDADADVRRQAAFALGQIR